MNRDMFVEFYCDIFVNRKFRRAYEICKCKAAPVLKQENNIKGETLALDGEECSV